MKRTGKFHFIQKGECSAELEGTIDIGNDPTQSSFDVSGQLSFPFLESVAVDPTEEIPNAPSAEPDFPIRNADGSTTHGVGIHCEFTLPPGVDLAEHEQSAICEKTAAYFSFCVSALVSEKTGDAHTTEFEKIKEQMN